MPGKGFFDGKEKKQQWWKDEILTERRVST